MANLFQSAGLEADAPKPLAEALRPEVLEDVVGQSHLIGPEGPIGRMLGQGRLSSMILWGPPGVGKTTIARLLADKAGLEFVQLSAVFSGVADLRKAFEAARLRREAGKGTLLFVDEIHRFNRAQQDGFLALCRRGRRDARRGDDGKSEFRVKRRFAIPRAGFCSQPIGRGSVERFA